MSPILSSSGCMTPTQGPCPQATREHAMTYHQARHSNVTTRESGRSLGAGLVLALLISATVANAEYPQIRPDLPGRSGTTPTTMNCYQAGVRCATGFSCRLTRGGSDYRQDFLCIARNVPCNKPCPTGWKWDGNTGDANFAYKCKPNGTLCAVHGGIGQQYAPSLIHEPTPTNKGYRCKMTNLIGG